jgi:hypothetical protein
MHSCSSNIQTIQDTNNKFYTYYDSSFLALLPDKPTNLTVTNITSRSAEISWADPEDKGEDTGGLSEFLIKLKKTNSLIRNTTKDKANNYEIDNLTPITTYEISVAVGNKHGFGEEEITSFKTSEEGKNGINVFSICSIMDLSPYN